MSLRGEATIGKLTMRCRAGHDSGRQRNELQLLLDGADFRPRGLPPSCILVVRSLPDPLPGNLRDRRCCYRVSREWERGARAHLEERLRGAARPDQSVIPNKCEAVVFRDEAELLACLALDVARGKASDKWWWQVVKVPRFRDLPSVLMEDVSLLPAILDVLDEWGAVGEVVEALSLEEVVEIAARMATALGGPDLSGLGAIRDVGIDVIERPRRYDEARRLVAEALFPKSTYGSRVALSRAAFIGISLALFRHATVARTPAFASAVRQWWTDSWARKTRAGRPIPKGSTGPEKLSEQTPQGEGRGMPATNPEPTAESNAEAEAVPYEGAHARAPQVEGEEQAPVADPEQSPKIAATLETALEPQHPAERAGKTPSANAAVDSQVSGEVLESATQHIGKLELPGGEQGRDPSGRPHLPAAPISPPVEEAPDVASSIATPLAGVSFSQPGVADSPFEEGFTTELGGIFYLITALVELDPPRALSSWALLEVLSSALLPDEIYDEDPIWTALRELDGRAADVPPPSEAREWLSPRLPELREHLREIAAECDPVPLAEFELAPIVVQRARVIVSRTHIDVLFCLDQILLPVRRAGLDRDPRWLPEFGRVIRFHFR